MDRKREITTHREQVKERRKRGYTYGSSRSPHHAQGLRVRLLGPSSVGPIGTAENPKEVKLSSSAVIHLFITLSVVMYVLVSCL